MQGFDGLDRCVVANTTTKIREKTPNLYKNQYAFDHGSYFIIQILGYQYVDNIIDC